MCWMACAVPALLPHATMCRAQPSLGAASARGRPPPGEVPGRGPSYPGESHGSAALREMRRLPVCRRELCGSAQAFPGASLAMPVRGVGPRLAQMSPGEQSAHASPGAALWIALRCRAEPPASEECARGEGLVRRCRAGVPAWSAASPATPASRSRCGMERKKPGEKVRARGRGCAGGERRGGVPGPTPRERAEARSGSPPHRRPLPTTAFRPGTRGRRRRTPAAGATRSASRRPRSRRRPTAPRRSGPPRGTGWCSLRRGARRRECGSCPARRETRRRSASPRG
jgi:hypothetical protein